MQSNIDKDYCLPLKKKSFKLIWIKKINKKTKCRNVRLSNGYLTVCNEKMLKLIHELFIW